MEQRRKTSPRVAAAVAAALGAQGLPMTSVAQEAVADDGTPLETIVVTATRRDVDVQDVPFNMVALGPEALESLRIDNLSEFTRAVPGLYVPNQGARGSNLMTVRGLNVTSVGDTYLVGNGTGGTVSTYLGDIPLYVDLKMIDLERVEALLGPQGTLYGAGTLAGAIRYLPNRPDPTRVEGEAGGRLYALGESDGMGADVWGSINLPIVKDKLALRVAVGYLDDPGFIDYDYVVREAGVSDPNVDLGDHEAVAANLKRVNDADTEETLTGRIGLFWQATDALAANFTYYYQDQEVGGRTINDRASFGTGKYVSANRFLEPNDKVNHLFALEVTWDVGFAELTSATGWSQFESEGQRDQTDLLLSFADIGYTYQNFPQFAAYTADTIDEDTFNQEFRLVSQGTEKWNWIVGAFFNRLDAKATSEEHTPGFPQWNPTIPDDASDLEYYEASERTYEETALFGELGYVITDRWQVTVGARWFSTDDDVSQLIMFPFYGIENPNANQTSDDGTIFKFNTSYEFSSDVMAYLTVSEGYRTGGLNLGPPCPQPLYCLSEDEILIEPDTTTNYELGLRSLWFDGRLLLNAAVYYIDWEDIQVQGVSDVGQVPITVNGGTASSSGLELSTRWSITDSLELALSYSYNDAHLTSDAPGLVDGADAFDGDRLAGTPEQQGTLLLEFEQPLANGWTFNANYTLTAVSDVYTKVGLRDGDEAPPDYAVALPGYAVHGASVGLESGRWTATLYADNLFNKYAVTSVRRDRSYIRTIDRFDTTANEPLDPIPMRMYFESMLRPRTVGLEVTYRFDL